jgi:hypothetical protein
MDGDVAGGSWAADSALLPGELADSDMAEDAEHWAAVYEELTGFLLEVGPPDETLERYRRRLAHWRCRRSELAGAREADRPSSPGALP